MKAQQRSQAAIYLHNGISLESLKKYKVGSVSEIGFQSYTALRHIAAGQYNASRESKSRELKLKFIDSELGGCTAPLYFTVKGPYRHAHISPDNSDYTKIERTGRFWSNREPLVFGYLSISYPYLKASVVLLQI
jgi:hypothetical protein